MKPKANQESTEPAGPGQSIPERLLGYLRQRILLLLLVALVISAILLVLVFFTGLDRNEQQAPVTDMDSVISETLEVLAASPAVSAQVYQAILPSLVVVLADASREENGREIGSGVVISGNADVLTALHVIEDSTTIELGFADGTRTPAFVSNVDWERDIAVLRPFTPPGLVVPATVGSSSALRVGDEVFAVGNPLGLVGSLSAGVVSGLNREFQPSDRDMRLEGVIQFDAAVNLGNSGGPLLNKRGQVVGIITGLINPTDMDTFIGIGFAVPIDVAVGAAGGPAK